MKEFKFGIWGCGMISKIHAEAILQIDGAGLSGAFDLNEAAKKSFCEKYNAKAFGSAEEMVSSDAVDAVCVCLPSGLHYDAAMLCIKNKKHVIVEKPMALTTEEAEEIIKASEEQGVFVMVISQLRYTDAIKEVKRIIDSGKLGTITLGNASMQYWRDPAYYSASNWRGTWEMDGGGALMNQGIHGIDLLQYLMGKVTAVSAYAKTLVHDIQTEDTLVAVLEYENGAVGTIQATTSVYPGYERKIEICGSKGSVVLREDTIEKCDVEGEDISANTNEKKDSSANRPDAIGNSLHAVQIRDFIQAVSENRKPWIDAREGKKALDIICAIYASAKTGQKIYL